MSFPNVDDAFWEWTRCVDLQKVVKGVANFEATETPLVTVTFDGVLEPVHPRRLIVKPEGQRNWKWWDLWTKQHLDNNDIVMDSSGKEYRVMSTSDWNNGGYRHHELVQDPPLGS